MITIYHLATSRSDRIVWLMEELELEYRLETYHREAGGAVPTAVREVHPLGKFPTIRDGDRLVCESGAIVEYTVARYGKGRLAPPADSPDFPRYLEWLHAAEGSAMLLLTNQLWVARALPAGSESPVLETAKARAAHFMRYADQELASRPYFAGESFTAADIMMTTVLTQALPWIGVAQDAYPHFAGYLERIGSRPAYRKAIAVMQQKG